MRQREVINALISLGYYHSDAPFSKKKGEKLVPPPSIGKQEFSSNTLND